MRRNSLFINLAIKYVQQGGDTLVFRLTVTNNNNIQNTDTVNINVQWTNIGSLTADAGPDQSILSGDMVTLDGSGSSDSQGRSFTYQWKVERASIDASGISLSNPSGKTTTFTAPDARGWIEFRLTVANTAGETSSDLVMVTINKAGGAGLIVNAGQDQVVAAGSSVQLSGSWTSSSSVAVTSYQWVKISGLSVTLSGSDEMSPDVSREINPTFTAPNISDGQAPITFQFIVKDATGAISTDEMTVTVDSLNYINNSQPPVADAGPDQSVVPGTKVTLDASNSSDPGKKALLYRWTRASGPDTIVLSDEFAVKPTFVAPSGASGAATFKLTVTDDATKTATDTVTITWTNDNPVANAGLDQTVSEGDLVTLNGSGSTDADDGISTYRWQQLSGPAATLSDASVADPTFKAPAVTANSGILTFELTVTDKSGQSSQDQVQITVNDINSAPTASAGVDQQVIEKASVTLTGAGSDPDGDVLSYQWTQTSGPTVTLSDASSQNATFTAPSVTSPPVVLVFSLTVKDGKGLAASDNVSITVNPSTVLPIANAGPDQSVDEGVTVILDGSGSSDADEGIKSYHWEQVDGVGVVLSDPSAIAPTFEAPKISEKTAVLKFKLTVLNYNGVENTDTVDITVNKKSSGGSSGCFISSVAD